MPKASLWEMHPFGAVPAPLQAGSDVFSFNLAGLARMEREEEPASPPERRSVGRGFVREGNQQALRPHEP